MVCCDMQENGALQKKEIHVYAKKCRQELRKSVKINLLMNEIISGMSLKFEISFVNNRVGRKVLKGK